MQLIRKIAELESFIKQRGIEPGCFADTGFLYAISYDDDQFHQSAEQVLDLLASKKMSIFANVISRMEFIDLIFRKQVTNGAIYVLHCFIKQSAKTEKQDLNLARARLNQI
jgi:phage-related protein